MIIIYVVNWYFNLLIFVSYKLNVRKLNILHVLLDMLFLVDARALQSNFE